MKNLFFFIFSIVLLSCAQNKPEPPLNRKVFVNLLIEMHLIESEVSFNAAIDQNLMNKSYTKYNNLFRKFNTDSVTVSKNFDFYSDKSQELLSIYQEVRDSLVKRAEKGK